MQPLHNQDQARHSPLELPYQLIGLLQPPEDEATLAPPWAPCRVRTWAQHGQAWPPYQPQRLLSRAPTSSSPARRN